jgi:FtsH-binding integral membrane protein
MSELKEVSEMRRDDERDVQSGVSLPTDYPGTVGAADFVRRMLAWRYSWVVVGALATLLGGWLVVTQPEHAPEVGGVPWGSVLYYLQWVIYASIIVLVGGRIMEYRRTRSARQDLGFVLGATVLYTVGFMLHYTPFVYEFPEGAFAGFVRAGVMMSCGLLGAVYGLSSTHRWY